uniref:Transposase n=1 Tax=Panagrellus redivivus TaxID=6233 RepID=A0A7E4VAK5_PANRE
MDRHLGHGLWALTIDEIEYFDKRVARKLFFLDFVVYWPHLTPRRLPYTRTYGCRACGAAAGGEPSNITSLRLPAVPSLRTQNPGGMAVAAKTSGNDVATKHMRPASQLLTDS